MSVWAISDLHLSLNCEKPMNIFGQVWENYVEEIRDSWLKNVKENDIVLISGDISWAMKLEDAKKDLEYFSDMPGKKIILRGNHDYWWKSISAVRSILPHNFFAIQNDAIKIDDIVFFGTRGWTVSERGSLKPEDQKIFDRETIRLTLAISEAKKIMTENDKLVCLMHYPPVNSKREDSPFSDLIEKSGAKIVVYGHLHGNDCRSEKIFEKNGVKYFLTSCDLIKNNLVNIL
ncbi:MAG: metallophosphoesterase [Clostridia bacterium]